MGANQHRDRISVVTLNYSGIFLSPFEYYALDNWQELQRIGRIFESELKKDYPSIRDYRNQEQPNKKQEEEYSRKTFKWDVGDIDKSIHVQRYTPLYTTESYIKNKFFAGLTETAQSQQLLTKRQFQDEWDRTFSNLPPTKNDDKDWQKGVQANKIQRYNCRTFDFLCYKSIVLYLYTKWTDSTTTNSYKDNFSYKFQDIVGEEEVNKKIVPLYADLMSDYFSRIDVQSKIRMTMDCLFKDTEVSYCFSHDSLTPQIVSFAQGTPDFRTQLEKVQNYFVYGPELGKTKQTILMLKKDLYFIPANHRPPTLMEAKQNMKKMGNELRQLQYAEKYQYFWTEQLKKEQEKDDKKTHQKKVEAKEKFFKELEKDFMHWTNDTIIVDFPEAKVMVGAVHFTSKAETNPLQVQMLGLIIHHWMKKDYKFIFSGDFNSYITTSEKDQHLDLFNFAKRLPGYRPTQTNIYPKHPKIITTKKKRTILQVQFHKMNDLIEKCIDQVITNFPINYDTSHVGQIKDLGQLKNNNQAFLPHKEHPYDHLLVQAFIDISKNSQR